MYFAAKPKDYRFYKRYTTHFTILIDDLEYNTEREHLIIPEYGRHLQKMINYAKSRETKEERNKVAKAIISVMGNLQPHLRDVPDFQHKLWDQLFIMSNFDIDVDSPYGEPSKEEIQARPEPLKYPQNHPKYRFYGNNIKTMIDVAVGWEEGELKEALKFTIANHMKKCFLNWNKDTVEDAVIFDHLYELSDGKLDLKNSEEGLSDSSSLMRAKSKYGGKSNSNKKSNKKKYSNNRKRY
ncbi:methionyl-tRNA formyltransferase [Flavobacteriales bacterium ALC-1]|nr:methionyl-tRNA formyltransferase [Flavobacteriales bacterium ALC-1]